MLQEATKLVYNGTCYKQLYHVELEVWAPITMYLCAHFHKKRSAACPIRRSLKAVQSSAVPSNYGPQGWKRCPKWLQGRTSNITLYHIIMVYNYTRLRAYFLRHGQYSTSTHLPSEATEESGRASSHSAGTWRRNNSLKYILQFYRMSMLSYGYRLARTRAIPVSSSPHLTTVVGW